MFISSYETICANCGEKISDEEPTKAEFCENCKWIKEEGKKIIKDIKKAVNKKMKKIKDTIGEDGCPCGEYNDGETYIKAHCWRTFYYDENKKGNTPIGNRCDCEYAGVHYRGNRKTAEKIAKEISENYLCDVKIVKL